MDTGILFMPSARVPEPGLAGVRLHQAMGAAGVLRRDPGIEVSTPEPAAELGLDGSPTILFDGDDPFGPEGAATSVSCRLYAVSGAMHAAPSVDQLVAALQSLTEG